MEMNFCRRCGKSLEVKRDHVFVCSSGHTIYANSSPAVAAIIFNDHNEVLTVRRSMEPGTGELDFPGGFCDDHENGETALARELFEEVNLSPNQYTTPKLISTGLDDYEFRNETIPVFSLIYRAQLTDATAEIVAQDDAEQAKFIALDAINPDDIYFDALREAVILLQNEIRK